ncbi:nucleotidyl transferase AbiEii/AbiGii toxin family protein [Flavihumibacter sp.]|uniref:nucleotidyl transferase AbiEii/AbiGii toxin family protein n=1 Tax=Flavihumibacter sp. TaxID=1913981 RepID=UPI002FC74B72
MNIISPAFAELLKAMEPIFQAFGHDHFLVGAVARDIHLSRNSRMASGRQTVDVDIAVLLQNAEQFDAIKQALVATGNFTAVPNFPFRLIYNGKIELDILPFGEIESDNRQLKLNPDIVLNMTGFMEIHPFVSMHQIADDLTMNVCPLEGLIILKLLSSSDNPDRTKDVADIEHIINIYFEWNNDEIYNDHFDVMDLYETRISFYLELVSAHILGRKMKNILRSDPSTANKIADILAKRPLATWQAMLAGLNE